MSKKSICTCTDCSAIIDDLKEWLQEAEPIAEQLMELGMTAGEARLHLHLTELLRNLEPRILLVSNVSTGGGGTWN